MNKVIPSIKVSEMQWWEQMETKEDKVRNGIFTSTGIKNAYRVAFAKGEGASRKDRTFNKELGIHTCCGSKVAWRHKVNCPLLDLGEDLTPTHKEDHD